MFEKEYRETIELMKRNEDHAVMRSICENIINILKENGVKVDGTIVKHMTRTDTLTVVDDFEVKFNGLDFTEHDKKYVDEINDLKKQLAEQTELAEHWYEEADKYEDILYIKAENSGYYDMTLQKFIELEKTAKEQKKQISELESKLKVTSNANEAMKCLFEEQRKEISTLASEKNEIMEENTALKIDIVRVKRGLEAQSETTKLLFEKWFSEDTKEEIPEELRSKDLNFNLVSKMLDVIELMLTDTQS